MLKLLPILLALGLVGRAQDRPASDFVNQYLPEWLRFSGEARLRYEGFTGSGFRHNSDDDHGLTRMRLNLTIRPSRRLVFVMQAQDARVFLTGIQPVPTNYQDKLDLRVGYVEIGAEKDLLAIRAGRQELDFGEQRMLGYNGWRNTAQSFDAVRVIVRHAGVRFDIFASAPVLIQDRFNRIVPGNNVHGIYGSIPDRRRKFTVEPYALWRLSPSWRVEAGGFGRLDVKYPGAHVFGKAGAFDYDSEMAAEIGHSGTDRIRAWAGHWRAGYNGHAG
ncbi:MAG TPA: alginate export family protein, partial [bacterium]